MKNKRIILERVETKTLKCNGCIFYLNEKCTTILDKFKCETRGKSYIWKEVKQKELENAKN